MFWSLKIDISCMIIINTRGCCRQVLMGMYASNTAAGVTVQHIEWVCHFSLFSSSAT